MPLYSQYPSRHGECAEKQSFNNLVMSRKRIKKQPMLVYCVKVSDTEGKVLVQTNVSQSQKIREKLEAMFVPRLAMV